MWVTAPLSSFFRLMSRWISRIASEHSQWQCYIRDSIRICTAPNTQEHHLGYCQGMSNVFDIGTIVIELNTITVRSLRTQSTISISVQRLRCLLLIRSTRTSANSVMVLPFYLNQSMASPAKETISGYLCSALPQLRMLSRIKVCLMLVYRICIMPLIIALE